MSWGARCADLRGCPVTNLGSEWKAVNRELHPAYRLVSAEERRMATSGTKKKSREKELEREIAELKRSIAQRHRKLTNAEKELVLCLKKCLKKLEHPPWHYGPRCTHP